MNRITTLLFAVGLPIAFAAPAIAQDATPLGTVVSGNTTVVFMAADTSDLDMQKLQTWSEFAGQHPNIARTLAYKPSLITDEAYATQHPELGEFFSAHPEIRESMAENPGNYVAIPPRPGE
jgi:hypothetical protein